MIRLPSDLLDRIDVDAARRGKSGRIQWLTDLSEAVLAGRLVPASIPSALSDEPVIGYSKTRQALRKAKA